MATNRPVVIKPRRVIFFDELRGLCVLLMIFYHGAYDVAYIFGVDFPFRSWPFNALQLFICCNFIFISGVSSRFSRSNLRRGLMVFGIAMLMSLGTYLFMPEQLIVFGVLHLLGVCMIIHGLAFQKPGKGIPAFSVLILCLLLFALTYGIGSRHIGFFNLIKTPLPDFLYKNYWLSILGFLAPNFYSADYFPLIPWAFLFFAGSFAGVFFSKNEMPGFFYKKHAAFLGVVGKHALIIYVLHQPVTYGVLYLFFMGLGAVGQYSF